MKRVFVFILSISIVFASVLEFGEVAWALPSPDWSTTAVTVDENMACDNCTVLADTVLTIEPGKTLSTKTINIENNGTLTVTGGGILNIHGYEEYDHSGSNGINGNLIVQCGTVNIAGGDAYPVCRAGHAIAGNLTVNGGTVTVLGGTNSSYKNGYAIVGSLTVTDGIVTVAGGDGASYPGKGIAGNLTATGGIIFVKGGAGRNSVDINGNVNATNCILFRTNTGEIYGTTYTLNQDVTIPEGKTLNIDSGKTLIIAANNTLTNNGTVNITSGAFLSNNGTLLNNYLLNLAADNAIGDIRVRVTFNANNGSGNTQSQYVKYNTPTVLSQNSFTNTGFPFLGWNTEANGTGTAYADGDEVTINNTFNALRLYAQWMEPEATPNSTFTAAGPSSGSITGLSASSDYIISGAGIPLTSIQSDASGSYNIASGLTSGTLSIVKTGNGNTTTDSLAQTINITKAETPNLTATQPAVSGGTGSISTGAGHEYSNDGGITWADCAGELSGLSGGTYHIRTKANGTVLASDSQEIVINAASGSSSGSRRRRSGSTSTVENVVTPEPLPAAETNDIQTLFAAYPDLDPNMWYAEGVAFVLSHEIMKGTDKGFEPNANTSRAQLAQMLFNLDGAKPVKSDASFTDLKVISWYADSVSWIVESGIAKGEGEKFGANNPITREQIAVFLYNYAKFKGYDVTVSKDAANFPDSDKASDWAKAALAWAVEKGIISGTKADDSVLMDAKGNATRAQVATMIQRFCENVAVSDTTEPDQK